MGYQSQLSGDSKQGWTAEGRDRVKPSNFIVIKKITKPQGASKSSVTEQETPGEGGRRGRGRKEGWEG